MSITLLTGIGEIFLGILLNVFIGKIVKIVFKKGWYATKSTCKIYWDNSYS